MLDRSRILPQVCEVKKKLAFGIAGVSAALIAGWRIVQSESESAFSDAGGDSTPTASPAPDPPSDSKPASTTPEGSATEEREPTGTDPEIPDEASKTELYEIAQGLRIKGRSKMSKVELRRAIEAEG